MPVSTLDIAKHVGVSRPVVSKVLNGGKTNIRIGDETRARIEAAAAELGYRPNAWAQAVSKGKTHAVGYICYELDDLYTTGGSPLVLAAASRVLAGIDHHMLFSSVSETQLREQRWPAVFTSVLVDALVIDGTSVMPQELLDLATRHALPSISINVKRESDCVHPDDIGGAREATERLLALGHRSIGFAGAYGEPVRGQHYSVDDRLAGYGQAMRAAGRTPRAVMRTYDVCSAGDDSALRAAMSGPDAVTAWVTYSPDFATDIYLAAMQMGLSVPEDVSIISLRRGGTAASIGTKVIDTMLLGDPRLGTAAGEMIMQKLEKPEKPMNPVTVPFIYHPGGTLAAFTP